MNQKPRHSDLQSNNSVEKTSSGFRKAVILLTLTVIVSVAAQWLFDLLTGGDKVVFGVLAAGLIVAIYLVFSFGILWRMIDTPFFAVTSLIGIAVGTAIGTFVGQNIPDEVFIQRYGEGGSKVLQFVQFDDVFHSWWYISFFILLCLSLIKLSMRRNFDVPHLGFHLAHLSPIVIIGGFWIDYFTGFRGIIQLEEGQQSHRVELFDGHTTNIKGQQNLPFDIRLDNFESAKFDPDYRIQLWELDAKIVMETFPDGTVDTQKVPRIISTFPLAEEKIRHIYGTDIYFKLVEFYPNYMFDYSYPANPDTIEPREPGLFMELRSGLDIRDIHMRSEQEGREMIADPDIGYWIEFYWEISERLLKSSDHIVDHGEGVNRRILIVGNEKKIYRIEGEERSVDSLMLGRFYEIPGSGNSGFTIKLLFPDEKYLVASPANRNDQLENPVAQVWVWRKRQPYYDAYLYPSLGRGGGTFLVPESPYLLTLGSIRDSETRFWRSDVSVVVHDEVLERKSISVNEPIYHRGYRFYQTDYDPSNPNYSGIGVSREPGLYIIYFGFIALVAGCLLLLFGKVDDGASY